MAREEIKLINPIKFIRSPARHGTNKYDYVFTIPRNLIKLEFVDPDKTYTIYLQELKKEDNDNETGKYIAIKDWNPTKKELQEIIKKIKDYP